MFSPRRVTVFSPSTNTGAAGASPVPGSEMPMLAWRDSPGPLTMHPITARVMFSAPGRLIFHSGIFARTCSCTTFASSWKNSEVVRPQPGQAVTIGVNARRPMVCSSSCATITSWVREALVVSALESAAKAEEYGLGRDRIILSAMVSSVQDLIAVYRVLARRSDYALHLGLTEAGMGSKGIVGSTAALAVLLQEGIGDTIRISLTPEPGAPRTQEVVVAQELLQTMGLRAFTPLVTACPGCGRTTSEFFQVLAQKVQEHVRGQMPVWKLKYPGVENLSLAVMGCVVNGPGESRHADIGISLPGTGEAPSAPVFVDGEKKVTLKGENIAAEFVALIDEYVDQRYARKAV